MDFNNTGAMKSPFSPRVRQSITGRRPIGLSSSKKNQSKYIQSAGAQGGDVIYKTPLITVETYGLPLPVMVTEALTFGSSDVSVRMSDCGWSWVVIGRRIITWQHSLSPDESGAPLAAGGFAARELTLPQTDLAHKADLVMVFYSNGAQMPSCVGVSPEGAVRLWPSVAAPAAHSDVTCELAGQECARLLPAPAALLLATTTCTLVLLTPVTEEGRQTVRWRTLRPPSGWLGGLGRRVSHMFFGSMGGPGEPRLVGAVWAGGGAALVCGGPGLQLWRGDDLHEHHLRPALAHDHLLLPHGEANSAEISALDVRAVGGELLLLLAVAAPRAPERRYAVAHIDITDPARPVVRALAAVRAAAGEGEEPRFLPLDSHVLLYTSSYIALASSMISSDKVEYISVAAEGDRILGAELCGGAPLLFSRKHGVLLLSVTDTLPAAPTMCDSPMGSPCPSDMYDGNLSLFEIDPHEVRAVARDACGQLQTAFLFHVRRERAASAALLQELFPRELGDADGALARTLWAVALGLLDDVPAGDPRWQAVCRARAASTRVALGSSGALQVRAQLHDKRRALALLRAFLADCGLLQRAGCLAREDGSAVGCAAALAELAERLAAAAALRDLHAGDAAPDIDAAMHQVVCGADAEEEEEVAGAVRAGVLSAADACYRRVSRVHGVLAALARAGAERGAGAARVCDLLTSILSEVLKCRSQWSETAPPQLGPRALLPALQQLIKRAVTAAGARAAAGALAAAALQYAEPLRARAERDYRRLRTALILPFVEAGDTERALALADRFQDLELIVQLCVEAEDTDKLCHYIEKYQDQGLGALAYSRMWRGGGRRAAALVRLRARGVDAWAARAPARAPAAALRAAAARDPRRAAPLLARLARRTAGLQRTMTAASLAKLCLVADEGDGEGEDEREDEGEGESESEREREGEEEGEGERSLRSRVEMQLALAEQQLALPRELRINRGLSGDDEPVLSPEEMIQMYVESESTSLTEYDYKKALDLTDFVPDMERRDELRLRVWCACIRREPWAEWSAAAPAEEMPRKMFFRLIDLVHVMGGDLELVLPPLEDILTAPELAELVSEPRAHFLLKYGYDALHNYC